MDDEGLVSLVPQVGVRPRLRVAVISMHTSPTASLGHSANGGMNVYVREVCRILGERGIATDVFTRALPAPLGQQQENGRHAARTEHPSSRVRVIYLEAGDPSLGKYELAGEVELFAERIEQFIAAEGLRYDLLYSHYWLSGAAACTLRGRLRVPWAHTAHTLAFVKNRRLARGARPEPELRLRLEAEISRAADMLIVSTEAEARDVVGEHGVRLDRCRVVVPGVDLAAFRAIPRPEPLRRIGHAGERVVLFVGRLERLKGVETALKAFALTAAAHPDARLVIVGGDSEDAGGEQERLASLASALGIDGRTSFTGSVPHRELPAYYAAAEACLMPSYSESFGLVGLEAQACGCPVLTSSAAGLASVVRDGLTGYLIDGDDPRDYAQRLARLLDHPELSERMGRGAAVLARRFSWSRTADRLEQAFNEIAESGQARVQASALHE